ncbi:retrotransposon protein, putative, ty1-copia subclass [Tanacetum coccineum]
MENYIDKNHGLLYTGCGTHICNTSQGLRESRKLKHGALSLYMGNGMRVEVEAIRSFDLILPSGLIIVLDNCHYVPTVTRGVVLISCLVKNGYTHTFTNYGISVSKGNVFYFNAIPRDGIYEIDMHNLYPNVSSMFNVRNESAKHALDSSYLWHFRLGHINKKRMDKLQRDGILQPTHNESLEKYKSCISRKMASKPFPHQVERAKDLLGLIHTDVCGPFRTVSREGASYFITFTDDFSRYGYIYLMKHKHEVFETFKVFQNEVKNQLGKKIKAIRSDRGSEYMSHEFVNHMKSCGIVSQLTPPYTPQHNEVFERRNQTLLDMVRSMMNLTTLPKSFWGYALKFAACILNMVPTKKVERTPYEI